MTIADFLTLTRRSWRLLLVTVLLGLLGGAAYGYLAPRTYQSTSAGFVTSSGANVFGGTEALTNLATSYLPLISSQPVLEKIATTAGVSPSSLAGQLSATLPAGSTLIQVTAASSDPKTAQTLANGALDALAAVIADVQTKAGVAASSRMTVIPMQNAVVPSAPSSPNVKLALGVGGVAGLVLGYLIVFLRRALDVRVRTGKELSKLAGTGLLGRIPKYRSKKRRDTVVAMAGESLRQIRAGLRFASVDSQVRSIVVTSANQSEGKSTTAASLAGVLAEAGQKVLLIDGDLRRPTVARTFKIDGTVGLSEVLSGQISLADVLHPTISENLVILPAGGIPPNPSEMLGSGAMKGLLETLSREYFIIVDAPPLLPVADAALLSAEVDGVVLVAASGRTRKIEVTEARAQLAQAKARVLGTVLNMVPLRDAADGYTYYRQYRSYYTKASKRSKKDEAPALRRGAGQLVTTPHES